MKLRKNMGTLDRGLRFVIAVVIITLYFTGKINGIWALLLLSFAVATTFTGISGYCPLYPLFGWNTCRRKEEK